MERFFLGLLITTSILLAESCNDLLNRSNHSGNYDQFMADNKDKFLKCAKKRNPTIMCIVAGWYGEGINGVRKNKQKAIYLLDNALSLEPNNTLCGMKKVNVKYGAWD